MNLSRLKHRIRKIIMTSSVPEDLNHAENTLDWLVRLKPDADQALQIAAFGHDIERAVRAPEFKLRAYPSYDAFKDVHAAKSASIVKNIITGHGLPQDFAEDVYGLVKRHERGGCPRSDLLRDADSLSFFEVNLPLYFEREGWEKTRERCRWGYRRLSPSHRHLLETFHFDNPEITDLVERVVREDGHSP